MIGLTLNGCGNSATSNLPEANISETAIAALSNKESFETKQTEAESTEEESSIVSTAAITSTEVIQGGPYGKISISVPNGWNYDTYPVDSDELMVGMYGIRFYPKDVTTGYIELAYTIILESVVLDWMKNRLRLAAILLVLALMIIMFIGILSHFKRIMLVLLL